jgi:hypothetical protein
MRKRTTALALGGALLAGSGPAMAAGWEFLPAANPGYEAEASLAVMGGLQDPDVAGVDASDAYGFELSLNCPTLKPPRGEIRQQISLTGFDKDGLEMASLELNPHYLVPLGENLDLGLGPGVGFVMAEGPRHDDGVFALQAGASLHYRSGGLFLGAEARYQVTQEANLGRGDGDLNNYRLLGKAGINF